MPEQPLLLGCSSWPPALASGVGGSSQLLPLASGSGWLLKVTDPGLGREVASPGRRPDLGHRAALLGRPCAVAARHSSPLPLTSDEA